MGSRKTADAGHDPEVGRTKHAEVFARLPAPSLWRSPGRCCRRRRKRGRLDEIMKSGVIRVGVNPTLPPLGKFDDKNEIVGFDVDYATEIAKLLGVKLEVVQVGSPDRIPSSPPARSTS